jgi:peptidoglycan/xylan/chitin deacetylase (PgdA/CDA1 family)
MKKIITTVMYHYVRDMHKTEFPGIKGVKCSDFREQIKYFDKYYNFISLGDCFDFLNGDESSLPNNPLLLTFDDGFIDHYENVFPILKEFGISGVFFPPVMTIRDNKILDVHKIHFILAGTNIKTVIEEIVNLLRIYKEKYKLNDFEFYYDKLSKANHLDCGDIIFVKRLLQVELDIEVRYLFTDILFKKFVNSDEHEFARKIYLNENMMREMYNAGMSFGGHGYNHLWLNSLTPAEQNFEVLESKKFLMEIGVINKSSWSFCFPYGAYNNSLLEILRKNKCEIAFTTEVDFSEISEHNALTLQRFDTIHFPFSSEIDANKLTLKSLEFNNNA